ncbi:hypothetical protein [Sagittula sp. MA-2]|jgi:hypothetical protein|uniref:hypothetical protein n=1 Tax=Sagittula sp. MA-2 TaxID=3048007 RepID=UPI0024C2A3F0|nr:hypothetical protein [Sagittula sp. MA-2]WHZ36505.1 hypothetical protein QNI11_05705 [Sagittula sp. MA-2]
MTDQTTPEKVKAFLDDLARISSRHGVEIGFEPHDGAYLNGMRSGFRGYQTEPYGGLWQIGQFPANMVEIRGIDLTQLSAHERMQIMGARSPDLARMLRDAFMAGVEATGGAYVGPFEWDADEYAAKIMGGQN